MTREPFVHPYIPNAVPETKQAMLREIGVQDVEELYAPIPERLRFKGELQVPGPVHSEAELKRAVREMLDRNRSTDDCLSFLGGGVAKHYVPAAVDEVVNRAEFLSAYCGANYSDHGKYQARWEFNSQLAELLDVDVVSEPIYDWGMVVGAAVRMASRITGRDRALVAGTTSPERLAVARTLCQPAEMPTSIGIDLVGYAPQTGQLDLDDLRAKSRPTRRPSTSRTRRSSASSRAVCRRSPRSPTPPARCSSPASTPSGSACSPAPAATAPTSSSATCRPLGRPHERRRRPGRLHRLQTTTRSSAAECPLAALHASSRPSARASTPSARSWPSAPATACATRARTGSAPARPADIAAAVYMSLMGPQGFR